MKKIEYIPKFTVSGKAMRLIMEIAAALERYKIVMELAPRFELVPGR